MDLKGSEIEFESEEKMFFKKISESKYPKVAVGKLSEKEIKENISPWSNSHSFRIAPAKILKERKREDCKYPSTTIHYMVYLFLLIYGSALSLREKVMSSKNLEEKDVEIEIGSELEMFYKKISESSYPKDCSHKIK
ncbi:hypothetical protein Avbf_15011 [Armadillidium vulgare]|nr:hypothetical protein Avbf_15011 [Armadillidium vulgare]